MDHFGAMAGDSPGLVLLAHHEAGDVLQEHQWNPPLRAELDKMRALDRGFAEQDAVVGDEAHGVAVQPGKTADQRGSVERLELIEFRGIHYACNDFANIEGLPGI